MIETTCKLYELSFYSEMKKVTRLWIVETVQLIAQLMIAVAQLINTYTIGEIVMSYPTVVESPKTVERFPRFDTSLESSLEMFSPKWPRQEHVPSKRHRNVTLLHK